LVKENQEEHLKLLINMREKKKSIADRVDNQSKCYDR